MKDWVESRLVFSTRSDARNLIFREVTGLLYVKRKKKLEDCKCRKASNIQRIPPKLASCVIRRSGFEDVRGIKSPRHGYQSQCCLLPNDAICGSSASDFGSGVVSYVQITHFAARSRGKRCGQCEAPSKNAAHCRHASLCTGWSSNRMSETGHELEDT